MGSYEIRRHGDQESEEGAKAFLEYMSKRKVPLVKIIAKLDTMKDKHNVLMTCFDWHDLTVGLPEIWSKFKIEIAASDGRGSYRKKQKYLIQFHNFIKEIEILGRDPEALFHSNIPTRRHNNPTQKFLSILNLLSIGNIDTNVARILSSEFSYIHPSKWAEERKFANGCEKYPELFCKLLSRIANSKAYKSVGRLEFFDTRFENKIAVKLLEEMVTNGMNLTELNMTNFFMFFHPLMTPQRETFDWVLFSRINHVVHLKTRSQYVGHSV